ncbi:MAG: DUF131 domain-containing protein [Theionarchaea archaeon]|nr:DUF131 domain-containing protein [Theionarchaea archaeon]MBU7001712.1 DUF131 domain-containing protein [Theionarchaea archaeon]MBU7021176.1 DUF131 domain-containing protein [Theionarchaea archaeon]MBU7034553.1 DUF131 domain-containing protein [Theionarchaea archaeon]MBU7040159.1 DUF131 domain-containing protein [Theionarchaea archaeon]
MQKLIALGILVIVAGFALVVIGSIGSMLQAGEEHQGDVRAGGVILIGPIPIIFGSDKTMALLSVAGAVLLLLAYVVWRRG